MKPLLTIMILISFGLCLSARAQDKPVVSLLTKDVAGHDVKVPIDRPSVIAFVRGDQEQSTEAIKLMRSILTDAQAAQVILILSGPTAAESSKLIGTGLPNSWHVVTDLDFADSGKMGVHVWPTTLVIKSDGTQVAHLAGLSLTFAGELQAHLEFAAGKLDEAGLQKRLDAHDVITDSPAQAASRHLQVAQRLIEQGHSDQARGELTEGLKKAPQDPQLLITLARVDVLLNQPGDAIAILDKLPTDSVPAWQSSLIRGRVLIELEKWADAKTILPDAMKLNPDPAEAHYLLGLCYQHDQQWQPAAEQFRQAFEKGNVTQKAAVAAPAK